MPTYWSGERFDAVTMQAALEILRTKRPRALYVLLGDTDEWAHDRRYDLYLELMAKSDRFIRTLWETAQAMPEYKGRTALVICTDHGRGATGEDWTDHGTKVPAAERVWMAVMGPGVPPLGVRERVQTTLGQVAATVAALVGDNFRRVRPEAAAPLPLEK
jgi:phosphopentomutase